MLRATFLAAAAALVLAAPAGAATYQVAGKQTAVDADAGTYKMSGGLRGDWATTSFEEVATEPYYEGKGTEVFEGCIDRRRDRSCKGDPSGTLSFTFRYWALFGSEDPESLHLGRLLASRRRAGRATSPARRECSTFVDSPTRQGVKTAYIGSLTLQGRQGVAPRRQGERRTAAGLLITERPRCLQSRPAFGEARAGATR